MTGPRKSLLVAAGCCGLLFVLGTSGAADDRMSEMAAARTTIRSTAVSWEPLIDFNSAVLTVSGPDGAVLSREFGRGETPQIGVVDKRGNALVDGQYAWELRFSPALDPAVKRALQEARETGDETVVAELKRQGKLPEGAVISGYFRVRSGSIITPGKAEARTAGERTAPSEPDQGDAVGADTDLATKDQVILDDLIVDGSACIGFDCVNGESFGFDTIRIKENNLRIKAQDTSSTASFPSNDWQITFNDSANGGANKFSIDDIDGGRTPFTIEAGAPSHSLYVDDGGRLGLGTSTPVVDVHIKSGNTPTLRLEQDGSSGFTPQTWDVAGNEANFFIRDATNGSTLPFRIFPGAPTNALTIEGSTGDVGLGTTSPGAPLHAVRTSGPSAKTMLMLSNNGGVRFDFEDTSAGGFWRFQTANSNNEFQITRSGTGETELLLDNNGNLTIHGDINSVGTTVVPDFVFGPEYPLMPINDLKAFITREKHLPGIPSAADIEKQGSVNLSKMQMRLLAKIEELTLYALDQQKTIEELEMAHNDAEQLHATIVDLQNRLEKLENGTID